jgi:DNA-binding response OmpR family regulator
MAQGICVLVIEDDDDSREMYEIVLRSERFAVYGANTAREGLRKAREYAPDVIVCDLGLPDGSGLDLVRQLRSEGYRRPAIALTGSSDGESREHAFAAGFTTFCVKPCTPAELLAEIRRALGSGGASESARKPG